MPPPCSPRQERRFPDPAACVGDRIRRCSDAAGKTIGVQLFGRGWLGCRSCERNAFVSGVIYDWRSGKRKNPSAIPGRYLQTLPVSVSSRVIGSFSLGEIMKKIILI